MPPGRITIPSEFQSQLRYVEPLDSRSDAEILDSLSTKYPLSATYPEKNVWTYWHSGIQSMPAWQQRNVINWVRILGPSWTVRVLDKVPGSPNNWAAWIEADQLPECFVKDTMVGPYVGPHSADFLRGAALYRYGGVWMDVGNWLIRSLDRICWDILADDNNEKTFCAPWMFQQHMANSFVAARKGDEFIGKWHQLFCHFWEGRNDYTGIIESPLIAFITKFKFSESEERGFHWDFEVDELTVLGYIGQCVAWIRLSWLIEPNGGFNGVEYYCKHFLQFDSLAEIWGAEKVIGFGGKILFDALAMKRDSDTESEEYRKAYDMVWYLLTSASLQKITRGKNLTKTPALGLYLDAEENKDLDKTEGTFAELLRYGASHFKQTRESVVYVEPIRPAEDCIIRKGLFEP